MSTIKLVIFDLWQTLAYRDVGYSTTGRMREVMGLKIPKSKVVKIFEESIQTKHWPSKYAAYENLCINLGLEATEKNVKLLMEIRDTAEAQTKLFPHAIPMLKQLKNIGLKIGLLSNSSTFAIDQIKAKTNLLDFIDYPLYSFDVGVIKPDLKLFETMLEITECKPTETIMIGDKPHDDVIPAQKMGMNAFHFTTYKQLQNDLSSLNISVS